MANKKGKKQEQFKVGDLVAAKVKGYPFWPAQIEKVLRPGRYQVRFFFTNDIGSTFKELKPYDALTESERKCKAKGFSEACKECEEKIFKIKSKEIPSSSSSTPTSSSSSSPILNSENQDHSQIENATESKKNENLLFKHAKDHERDQTKDEEPTIPDSPPPLEISTVQDVQFKNRSAELDKPTLSRESKRAKVNVEKEEEMEAQKPCKRISSKRKCDEQQVATDIVRKSKRQRQDLNGSSIKKQLKEDVSKNNRAERKSTSLPKDTSVNESQITTDAESGVQMDCSLNDLTSEQANADRGHVAPKSVSKSSDHKQHLAHETIGRLKKKLEQKMEEKEKLKRACMEKKQFEKAAKFLPMFSKHFGSLDMAITAMLNDPSSKQNASQFEASIIKCKKHSKFLRECLFNLYSDYGKEQKELREFNKLLVKVVLDLTKNKELSSQGEAKQLKKTLKKDTLRKFINDAAFSDSTREESVGERKENSSKQRAKPR